MKWASLLLPALILLLPACREERTENNTSGMQAGRTTVIGLQPLGRVDPALLDSARTAIRRTYGIHTAVLPSRPLPSHAFINIKTPRYRADSLLLYLRAHKPDSVDYIIGLTTADISTTKYNADGTIREPHERYRDFGVFGLGYLTGPSCVVSTYRLRRGVTTATLATRLQKVVVHELGHNMGLDHCPDPRCVMRDAVERMSSIDGARCELCGKCRSRLRTSRG